MPVLHRIMNLDGTHFFAFKFSMNDVISGKKIQ